MLPTQKEQDEFITYLINGKDPIRAYMKEYAKWYAERVIEEAAEVAEVNLIQHNIFNNPNDYAEVDKQSIYKLKEQL